jgi:hypothetical protein
MASEDVKPLYQDNPDRLRFLSCPEAVHPEIVDKKLWTPFEVPPSGGSRPRKRGTPNRPYTDRLPTESTWTA